jgi:hypothetical protein
VDFRAGSGHRTGQSASTLGKTDQLVSGHVAAIPLVLAAGMRRKNRPKISD